MTPQNNYISVAISLQNADGSVTNVSFDNAESPSLPALDGIVEEFENLTEGYMIWRSASKRAITYFKLNDISRQKELQIILMMDDDVIAAGRPILNLIGSIRSRLADGESLEQDKLEHLIAESGFVEEPLRSQCGRELPAEMGVVGCRTYSSPGELANIFGFPRQEQYGKYNCIVVVPALVAMRPRAAIEMITSPLDRSLLVVCPDGVEASKQSVSFSDNLAVTYHCPGFDDVSVMFEVGTTNRYVRINGPALAVNTARHAGIEFHKRIPYSVAAAGGFPIDTFTILINDRTANRTDEGFEVSNTDFYSGKATITFSSTNFSQYSREFTPEELERAAPIEVVLNPESRSVLLRLDFGDGRIVEENIDIEKNTPEYCQLRAGRFHGFRAYRIVGSTPETYNVDVRKPTPISNAESADEPAATEIDEPREDANMPVAPVVEVAETAIRKEYKPERKAPEFVNETKGEKIAKKRGKSRSKRWIIAGLCVAAVAFSIWFFSGTGGEKVREAMTVDSVETQTTETKTTATSDELKLEQADAAYLNKEDRWQKDEIKSQKYQALINAIVTADVDAMVQHEYFKTQGKCTNKFANFAIDFIWKAKGSSMQDRQADILRGYKEKDMIDVYKLYDDLSRKMPSEDKQNKSPRPQASK